MENYYPELYFSSIHILVAMALFCSLLLWSQRDEGQRSRRFFAWNWFFLLILCVGWLPIIYSRDVVFEGVLPVSFLVFCMALIAIMTIYPIEVVVPRWFNRKWLLVLFSPVMMVLAVCGVMRFFGDGFRVLNTMSDITRYCHEPNVWIRFFIVLLTYGYAFILCYIPQSKIRGNITLDWMRAYTFGNMGIALLYLGLILFGAYPVGIFHALYFALYVGYITYQELYVRLFIPNRENPLYITTNRKVRVLRSEAEKKLWASLRNYMQKKPAWHNPNFSKPLLADAIGVAQAEIAAILESMRCGEFDNYVAEVRIREFCNLVNNGDSITIEDTFFRVGFRYRDVASQQFIRIMHQSPEEYIRKRGERLLIDN